MNYEEALEAAGAKIHCFEEFGDYQGKWYAVVTYEGRTFLTSGEYGSCSGCDAFEAEIGMFEHIWDNTSQKYIKNPEYVQKLKEFGKYYLDPYDIDVEIKNYVEVSKWDYEGPKVLEFLNRVKVEYKL